MCPTLGTTSIVIFQVLLESLKLVSGCRLTESKAMLRATLLASLLMTSSPRSRSRTWPCSRVPSRQRRPPPPTTGCPSSSAASQPRARSSLSCREYKVSRYFRYPQEIFFLVARNIFCLCFVFAARNIFGIRNIYFCSLQEIFFKQKYFQYISFFFSGEAREHGLQRGQGLRRGV